MHSTRLIRTLAFPVLMGLGTIGTFAAAPAAPKVTGGNGTLFMGAYSGDILAVDEATEKVSKIPLKMGFPYIVRMSRDTSRLYALNADMEHFEVVDTASKQSVDTFSLSEPGKRSRVSGYAIDSPRQVIAISHRLITKAIDHFEIGEMRLVLYDMKDHKVLQSIQPPGGEDSRLGNMRFSPDGKLLYLFEREILIFDTATMKQVDHWDMSRPVEPGLGRGNAGSADETEDDDGSYTSLFTVEDPVQHRRLLGIGRINLSRRTVDYFALGPAEQNVRLNFALTPDHNAGYILAQSIDKYELWIVDMNARHVTKKIPFDGRPRMAIHTSTNGKLLYIYEAGNTIDYYDAADFKFLRTLTLDADMTYNSFHVAAPRSSKTGTTATARQ